MKCSISYVLDPYFLILFRYYLRSHLRNQKAEGQDMFFLIGQVDPNDKKGVQGQKKMMDLEHEIEEFEDFIVGDYIDSYKNLTLKTFSGYKYYHQYCGGAKASWQNEHASQSAGQSADSNEDAGVQWILMQDDDTVIDEHLFSFLLDDLKNE